MTLLRKGYSYLSLRGIEMTQKQWALDMMRRDSLLWERMRFDTEEEARKEIERLAPVAWELYHLVDGSDFTA